MEKNSHEIELNLTEVQKKVTRRAERENKD